MEKWVPLKDYPGYEISSEGRVRSIDRYNNGGLGLRLLKGKILKIMTNKANPYPSVGVVGVDGKHVKIRVHLLVALHFVPGKSVVNSQVNHIDGDKINCRSSNLEWVSAQRNIQHAYETGLMKRLVSPLEQKKIVLEIEQAKLTRPSLYGVVKQIAEKYNVPVWKVSSIARGKRIIGKWESDV